MDIEILGKFAQKHIGKVQYAVISAMREELHFLKDRLMNAKFETVKFGDFEFTIAEYKGARVLLGYTGLGTTFAASMLTLIHQTFYPDFVLFCGVAGAIDKSFHVCDVLVVEQAFEAELQGVFETLQNTPFETCLTHPTKNLSFPSTYTANKDLLVVTKEASISNSDLRIHYGTAVTSNSFPAPKELFEKIKIKASAIDMETSALYQVAWLLNFPIIAFRGISNKLNQDGTDDNIGNSNLIGSAEAAGKVLLSTLNLLILKNSSKNQVELIEHDVNELVKKFKLQPHPEGGFYVRNHESKINVTSSNLGIHDGETRRAGTSIYYLLRGEDFSAFHILKSDELWHYYKGSAIKLHIINRSGEYETQLLGDPEVFPDAKFQVIVPAEHWFAAEIANKNYYSFVGCTVAPGFEFKDFKLGDRDTLTKQFPDLATLIERFTQENNEDDNLNHAKCSTIKLR
jgi:5'-methylthioadenosine/S-adenosylhomocysteine nucleosidase